ncbi:hypothetical protein KFE25_012387 [Diacronema lutheri]|uniref:Major facilitator superfamily (MFS) profile domain-containing protein n=1 Tax=Diacronema lutheri TaxID=2081491 RepID=A0A8J6C9Y8_DIALT|nr:hypothetical protein KFE25_012387 [Diacronema lutheri]
MRPSAQPLLEHVVEPRRKLPFGDAAGAPHPTPQELLDALPLSRFHARLFAVCGCAWLLDGMEVILLSFVGPAVRCEWAGVSDYDAALMTTVVFAGMTVGAVSWGALADTAGRRSALGASTTVVLCAGLACAAAPSFGWLLCAQACMGVGVSGAHVAFTLLTECTPQSARGRAGIALSAFWSAGAVAEAALAQLVLPRYGWRALVALSTAPAILLLVALPCVPESPRFYAARGLHAEAEAGARAAARQSGAHAPRAALRVARGENAGAREPHGCASGSALRALLSVDVRRPALTVAMLWLGCSSVYYGAVLLAPQIFAEDRCGFYARAHATAGDGGGAPARADAAGRARQAAAGECALALTGEQLFSNLVATAGEVPGLLLTLGAIDALGRRRTMAFGGALVAAAFACAMPCASAGAQAGALFVARGAAIGYFQAAYVYSGEALPNSVRGVGLGCCTTFSRLGGMATPFVAEVVASRASPRLALAVYAALALACAALAASLELETHGMPLFDTVDELRAALARARAPRPPHGADGAVAPDDARRSRVGAGVALGRALGGLSGLPA